MPIRTHAHGTRTDETTGATFSALPPFAALEASLASVVHETFHNIHLTDGVHVIGAVLDRGVEFVGEFGLTGERRDRITVQRADAAWFVTGLEIQADPNTYSVEDLLAMERTKWKLDRKASDDGYLVEWWLK
jgi:hypothetical protein